MNWTPKSEEEVTKNDLLEPGLADFEVKKAETKVSAKGNKYLNVMLVCWDVNNDESVVWDILMDGKMAWKLRHFFYACGCGAIYESGNLSEPGELVGRAGQCKLRVGQDRERKHPPKMEVADYVVDESEKQGPDYKSLKTKDREVLNPISDKKEFEDDQIPF
jgi:hypothetical protein